jgi:multidrug efflux pump subunit AcrB
VAVVVTAQVRKIMTLTQHARMHRPMRRHFQQTANSRGHLAAGVLRNQRAIGAVTVYLCAYILFAHVDSKQVDLNDGTAAAPHPWK